MGLYRGVGTVGNTSDNSLIEEVTEQALTAQASATQAQSSALSAQQAAEQALAVADILVSPEIEDIDGLQSALDGKVDDPQVLTDVPENALFTDTTYTNVSSFVNDEGYLDENSDISGGVF